MTDESTATRSGHGSRSHRRTLASLFEHRRRIAVLDGGFATHLEDALSADLSNGSLWSAQLLLTPSGRSLIRSTHEAFLSQGGVDVLETATYQTSHETLSKAGIGREEGEGLMRTAVRIAAEARRDWMDGEGARLGRDPLLALSLGPRGTANGAEYTGDYRLPDQPQQPSLSELKDFHLSRLQVFERDPETWECLDLVMIETVPRLDEAQAVIQAWEDLISVSSHKYSPELVISFVFPDGRGLPWPPRNDTNTSTPSTPSSSSLPKREELDEISIKGIVDLVRSSNKLGGVGINCTKPYFIKAIVEGLTKALREDGSGRAEGEREKPCLCLYPDGGLVWDGHARKWSKPVNSRESTQTKRGPESQTSWATSLMASASSAIEAKDVWKGVVLGGCCKATCEDIRGLRELVEERLARE